MAQKLVTDVDGRQWFVTLKILWSDHSENFEHEKEGGRNAVIAILVVLGLLLFALIAWAVEDREYISVPWWMFLILLAVVVFFPGRWALRRRWLLRAEGGAWPDEDGRGGGGGGEEWSGFIRGRTEARAEFKRVIKSLERRGTPARANSPLQPQ
ncbi:hypothetical protein [Actinomycetospora termitidis]|uniref:DUF983 domain-containing protein n=1 Tax=Actinomycetospora termitidis TaxID=3053470 RepID=A0ABT7M3F1_9PSEU|nr:hypothetical protein [Actinomycetospora sp. Odt1-22]MDL5154739.1 hypothetical protein [Actinomycetospora sp. Odt1-22]